MIRARPITRVLLWVLAVFGALPGVWAALFPESFYSDFPGVRSGWVSADGPYNEHLIRDVGAMFLALGALAAFAAISGQLLAARLAGAAWLVFNGLHFAYHVRHLGVYQPIDQWLNVITEGGGVLLAMAVLLIPGRKGSKRST
jgi:Domain of unknown function (DUF4345)